jgi:toxin CptA
MHAAPSVSYPVGRSPFAAWAHAALGLAGLAVAGVWILQSAGFGWRQAAALAAVAACGSLALSAWLRSPQGVLRWDGLGWQWEEGGLVASGSPEIALDLQSRLLLRWRGEGSGTRWLWLEKESDSAHWDALRRAVYSRASAPIPAFPQGGKESPPTGRPPGAEQ